MLRSALLVAAFVAQFAGSALADTITIRADEWLPFNGPANLKPAGYMITAAQRIAEANGHKIQYSTMPWDDAVEATRRGDYDCVVGALKSDAEGFMFPSVSWGESLNAFYGKKELDWEYDGVDSLKDLKLVVIDSYSYDEDIDNYVKEKAGTKNVEVIKSSGRAQVNAFMRIVTRRGDLFLEDINVADLTIQKLKIADSVEVKSVLGLPDDLYIACTPAHPRGRAYADMFAVGLLKLRRSGELQKILDEYGLKDWAADE